MQTNKSTDGLDDNPFIYENPVTAVTYTIDTPELLLYQINPSQAKLNKAAFLFVFNGAKTYLATRSENSFKSSINC